MVNPPAVSSSQIYNPVTGASQHSPGMYLTCAATSFSLCLHFSSNTSCLKFFFLFRLAASSSVKLWSELDKHYFLHLSRYSFSSKKLPQLPYK